SRSSISPPASSPSIAGCEFDSMVLWRFAMSKWILAVITLFIGAALIVTDADAKRLGGGRSVGAQRNVTAPPAATPAKPAQQAAPQQQGSKWGMLGGLLG